MKAAANNATTEVRDTLLTNKHKLTQSHRLTVRTSTPPEQNESYNRALIANTPNPSVTQGQMVAAFLVSHGDDFINNALGGHDIVHVQAGYNIDPISELYATGYELSAKTLLTRGRCATLFESTLSMKCDLGNQEMYPYFASRLPAQYQDSYKQTGLSGADYVNDIEKLTQQHSAINSLLDASTLDTIVGSDTRTAIYLRNLDTLGVEVMIRGYAMPSTAVKPVLFTESSLLQYPAERPQLLQLATLKPDWAAAALKEKQKIAAIQKDNDDWIIGYALTEQLESTDANIWVLENPPEVALIADAVGITRIAVQRSTKNNDNNDGWAAQFPQYIPTAPNESDKNLYAGGAVVVPRNCINMASALTKIEADNTLCPIPASAMTEQSASAVLQTLQNAVSNTL